ncbi:hypothetical protein [Micromonospora sp. ATCC 39149]|uniref:Uncharacterized protein n=1 Tax=Micromonospora carbonacea TaxID=47853 RepID=A0A7D5YA89_9ACTN|nr:hypothetical protein HZU44_15590 [Micromonospora carbonacea]
MHGRFDLGSPLETPWSLAWAWADAELIVVNDSGHTGSDALRGHLRAALDRLAPAPTGQVGGVSRPPMINGAVTRCGGFVLPP